MGGSAEGALHRRLYISRGARSSRPREKGASVMRTQHHTQPRGAPARGGADPRSGLLAGLPVQERRLTLNGIETAVLEGGEGPPLVLLHGPGEHAAKWLRVLPELAREHRVVAPDLPGHGSTEARDEPLEAERVLTWLGELIAQTCTTRPTLVGQILGGAIAARFAAEHGDRLERLVLVDALGLQPFQPAPEFGRALMAFMAQPSPETHEALWRRCAFDLDVLREALGERWALLEAYNLERATPSLRRWQEELMAQFGLPEIGASELARIRVPACLVWGRHDLATPLGVAEATSRRTGWPLHVIDRAGDDPPLEQPEAFVRALRAARSEARA